MATKKNATNKNKKGKTAVVKCAPKKKNQSRTTSAPKKKNQRRTTSTTEKKKGTVRTVAAKQITKVSAEKGTTVAVTGKLFQGAKAIELTEKSISVTHAASRSRQGVFESAERRRYVAQTPETVAAANKALSEAQKKGKIKKIRVEFKR